MTEQELIDLRDSLLLMNNSLTSLDTRVTALESNNLPKGTYFNSLKEAFENSPECCNCDVVEPMCNCENATNVIYLLSDGDSLLQAQLNIEINSIAYTGITDPLLASLVSFDVVVAYVYSAVTNEYMQGVYALKITNITAESLCVRVSTSQDSFGNPAYAISELTFPLDDGNGNGVVVQTSFPINTGNVFTFTSNPTIAYELSSNAQNIATFCLVAV
jgi:hypothetical protein